MTGVTASMLQTTRPMVRTASGVRVFANNPTLAQVRFVTLPSSPDAAKRGIEELKEAASHADHVATRSKEEAVRVAENISEKSKHSVQEAWSATKDAAQKVQNIVTEKTEASVGTVKENIEATKQSINTKN